MSIHTLDAGTDQNAALFVITITLIALVILAFVFATAISSYDILIIVPSVLALSFIIGSRGIRRTYHKLQPRLGAIIFGGILFFVFLLVPDPNSYANIPWPHKLIHVFCSHAFLWVYYDQAEQQCHPGPESEYFMSQLQMLTRYPVYAVILNLMWLILPAIAGLLVVAALPKNHKK
jgi:hypothetical protein